MDTFFWNSIARLTAPSACLKWNPWLRDLGGFVEDARRRMTERVKLDDGMTIEWSGQYEHQLRARRTLQVIVPSALAIIFLLLFLI